MLSQTEGETESEQVIQQIITFIIAKTYWKAGAVWQTSQSHSSFFLHLNMSVIYVLTFGERTGELTNVIRMRMALDAIDQSIKIPMKIEMQLSQSHCSI